MTDGSKRYNCTIIDLHDRSVISSITDKNITADLAKRTLEKAIHSQPGIDLSKLMLHSDQGSQCTSKEFTEFCEKLGITRSMSKACAGILILSQIFLAVIAVLWYNKSIK